jgi:hypothetical protein
MDIGLLPDFLYLGDKKIIDCQARGRLGHPAEQRIQIGAKGLAYDLAEFEDLSIRLLGRRAVVQLVAPLGSRASDSMRRMQKKWRGGIEQGIGYFLFRHSHGGTGCGSSAHDSSKGSSVPVQ